jgi:precorrin-2 dehydrogenase/sirohydrochlorin ferrochelatase
VKQTAALPPGGVAAAGDPAAGAPTPRASYRYPLMLDLTHRLVVIIGGGAVAARKAAGVVEAGAMRVRCVSPLFKADFPACVEKVHERYRARHLAGAGLVFAATDSTEVNDAVVHDARALGVLVSRADNGAGAAGDFATPAVLRQSAVTVTVSAASPALSALIRDGLGARWDERWSKMADAMRGLRPLLTAGGLHPDRRAAILRDLATEEALCILASGGEAALLDWLAGRHAELKEWNAGTHATGAAGPGRQAQDTPDHA